MKEEDKKLLLTDLSARLTYGVKAYVKHWSKLDRKWYEGVYTVESIHPYLNDILVCSERGSVEVILGYDDYKIKPYLFPLSSMTEEQKEEFIFLHSDKQQEAGHSNLEIIIEPCKLKIDWLNKNHFDYRGLIEKELANDASFLNVY